MKQMLKNRLWIVAVLCLVLALSSEDAFARGWRGGGRGSRRGGIGRGRGFAGRRGSYYYRGGRWYRHGWLGSDIFFSALVAGALIDSLPSGYTRVVYGGVPYYYYDGYYYRPYRNGGYVVVEPPVAVQPVVAQPAIAAPTPVTAAPTEQPQAQVQIPDELIVNIPNTHGGYTKVTLKKSGDGFAGPQGEYYPGHPSVQQLKVLYGK